MGKLLYGWLDKQRCAMTVIIISGNVVSGDAPEDNSASEPHSASPRRIAPG
jgi:hypothetical protein